MAAAFVSMVEVCMIYSPLHSLQTKYLKSFESILISFWLELCSLQVHL